MSRPIRIAAGWALPVTSPAIERAALLIDESGRLAAVGPDVAVPEPESALTLDLSDAVVLPGLVNTHTHLELTGFPDTAKDAEFTRWILDLRRRKQEQSGEDFLQAARRGVRDCWAGGVTTVADTGDSGAVVQALAEAGGSGIVYHEVFGPDPRQVAASLAGLDQRLGDLASWAGGRVRLGVSPHAPYTVSGVLYGTVARLARDRGFPTAVHLAESPAESAFVKEGRGPFAEAWRQRGIPLLDDPAHLGGAPGFPRSPVEWLEQHGVLGPDTLCIHTVQLDDADIELLARRRVAIAHCPLSNTRHGHGPARLAELRQAGIRVGIGTDSVASVGRLDLLAEARAAGALAGLDAPGSLALATLEGARALGLEAEIGSLEAGKWADLAAVRVRRPLAGTPEQAVLDAGPDRVCLTMIGGRVVHRPFGAA